MARGKNFVNSKSTHGEVSLRVSDPLMADKIRAICKVKNCNLKIMMLEVMPQVIEAIEKQMKPSELVNYYAALAEAQGTAVLVQQMEVKQ